VTASTSATSASLCPNISIPPFPAAKTPNLEIGVQVALPHFGNQASTLGMCCAEPGLATLNGPARAPVHPHMFAAEQGRRPCREAHGTSGASPHIRRAAAYAGALLLNNESIKARASL
jgi:hypothetical protein